MNMKKTLVSAAITGALGTVGAAMPTIASAVALDAGNWQMIINTSPTGTAYNYPDSCAANGGTLSGGTYCTTGVVPLFGNQTAGWESSFTFGAPPPSGSIGATDNATNVAVANDFSGYYGTGPGTYGTAALGDEFGKMVFDIDASGNITGGANASFQIDTFFATAGGSFAQFINGAVGDGTFSGNVDASGNMSFGIVNRMGAIDGPTGGVIGPWNIEPSTVAGFPTPVPFTTASLPDTSGAGTIAGTTCTGTATAVDCVLVSYGSVGSAWGTFKGNPYYETWNISMTRIGDVGSVPVPAAVWLFGSGLLGLVGVARRKKTG